MLASFLDRFPKAVSIFRRNIFPIALFLVLELLFLFFSAGAWPLIFFVLVFFIPGFLVVRHFLSDVVEQMVFAFPLSIILVGFPIYFFSFFYSEAISWISILLAYILAVILCKWISRPSSIENNSLPRWMVVLLILSAGLGLFVYVNFVGVGSLHNSYPVGTTAWDKVIHYAWVRSMAETGQTALPLSLTGGLSGIESTYFTPLSIFPLGLFARYSGMTFWGSQDAYASMVFVFSILGLFALSRRVLNENTALLSSFIGATPFLYYFFVDLAGMYRVGLVVLFSCLFFLLFERFFNQEKNINILMGIILSGFLFIHAISIILFFPIFLFVLYNIYLKKMTFSYIWPTALIAFAFFIPYWISSRADYIFSIVFTPFEWLGPSLFEYRSVNLVGPIILWGYIWEYLFLAFIGFILFVFLQKRNLLNWKKIQIYYLASGIWILLLTAGFTNFIFNYAGKWRAIEYFIFIVPFCAFLLWEIFQKIPKISIKQKMVGAIIVVLLLHSSHIFQSKSYTTKIDPEVWSVLEWVNQNTPRDAKVYSILGFYQHTHLLSDRPGNYSGESNIMLDYLQGADANFPLYCVPGFRRTGLFSIEPYACPTFPSHLEDYDFLLADYQATTRAVNVTSFIHNELALRGFVIVHQTKNIEVYQNMRAST